MALYKKKLRSVSELEREKQKLLKKSRELEQDDIFTLKGISGSKQINLSKESLLFDFLPGKNQAVDMLLKLVKNKFANKEPQEEESEPVKAPPRKKKSKDLLKTVAKEFIGGYLKWKAIELSYKGIRYMIKKKKEAKE